MNLGVLNPSEDGDLTPTSPSLDSPSPNLLVEDTHPPMKSSSETINRRHSVFLTIYGKGGVVVDTDSL